MTRSLWKKITYHNYRRSYLEWDSISYRMPNLAKKNRYFFNQYCVRETDLFNSDGIKITKIT